MTTREIDTRKIESIKLPRSWKNGKAYIFESKATLIIKKISDVTFSDITSPLKEAAKKSGLTESEATNIIHRARKKWKLFGKS